MIAPYVLVGSLPGWCGLVRYALGEVVDGGDVDHGFGTGVEGLVVAGKAAAHHDPSDAAFYNPASFDDVEPPDFRVSVDDFDVDSQVRAVLDEGFLEAGVDPAFGDGG